MKLPTFLILGAAKAGTTSLYYYLSQHPDVLMSHPKEPLFFQAEYERGAEYYWDTYFKHYRGQKQVGEAAHRNLYLPFVVNRIAALLPNPRFIVICRHPVDRAFSHYWYNYTRNQEPLSFEDALDKNRTRLKTGPFFMDENEGKLYVQALDKYGDTVRYPSYIDSGYYAEQIERYTKKFGRDRVKVIFFEDLTDKIEQTVTEVFNFLGLEPIELQDGSPQNQPLPPLVSAFYRMVGAAPGMQSVPGSWRDAVKRKIAQVFHTSKPAMNAETRAQLVEHFKPHNDRLAQLTGRDLGHWN